jgi:CHAT domain-containing protein
VELHSLNTLFGDRAKLLTRSQASEQDLNTLHTQGELGKYRYLHFATHGAGNSVKAFESALILSQDRPRQEIPSAGSPFLDNQLSAREVLDFWKLDAELVTLSACETAIGRQGGGDGLLGFAQAFLLAGSRSVCLSLWKVDDTATSLLMQRFYRNLLGKRDGIQPMKKAIALKEAKEWLRNLTGAEAKTLTAEMRKDVKRGKNEDLPPVIEPKAEEPKADPRSKPFAHPKYWAAFILIGDPD